MEAVRTMIIHGDLPPVGHKISLHAEPGNKLVGFLGGHQYWVDSGTSALALAILDAKLQFPEVQRPRVIVPGYCCPDLIAACVYSGVEPVAVDIEENDPSYNLDNLRAQLDARVIAIIAVNFMGIAERLDELRALIQSLGLRTRLIEDNAQWFPVDQKDVPVESDYVVFSFGRGKPLSLLGGGLVLKKLPLRDSSIDRIQTPNAASASLSLKIRIYNYLLIPQLFFLLNRNPVLTLGETKYVALERIQAMDEFRRTLLDANFCLYSLRKFELKNFYDNVVWGNSLQKLAALTDRRSRQLLRYPLLCPSMAIRDGLLKKMRACGLGVTPMYATAIDQVNGVSGLVTVPQRLKNAKNFAERFMTLPMHSSVSAVYQKEIKALLDDYRL